MTMKYLLQQHVDRMLIEMAANWVSQGEHAYAAECIRLTNIIAGIYEDA